MLSGMTSTPASTSLRRLLLAMAILTAVGGMTFASASAAKIRGTYAVSSIVLTMSSNVTTTSAVLGDGTTGTPTTTLKTTLRSKKPVTLKFANTLKPLTYPWRATGTTKVTATAVLVRTH